MAVFGQAWATLDMPRLARKQKDLSVNIVSRPQGDRSPGMRAMNDTGQAGALAAPWNRGRMIGPKRALKPKHIWSIRIHLEMLRRIRDLAMFDIAIDSKLRGCDLVALRE